MTIGGAPVVGSFASDARAGGTRTGSASEWPLTERDVADTEAEIAAERRALDRIDDVEPMPHMVGDYLARRASTLAYIARLEALLVDGVRA